MCWTPPWDFSAHGLKSVCQAVEQAIGSRAWSAFTPWTPLSPILKGNVMTTSSLEQHALDVTRQTIARFRYEGDAFRQQSGGRSKARVFVAIFRHICPSLHHVNFSSTSRLSTAERGGKSPMHLSPPCRCPRERIRRPGLPRRERPRWLRALRGTGSRRGQVWRPRLSRGTGGPTPGWTPWLPRVHAGRFRARAKR